jgi:MerR family redox-sensitive transcriptional activator SoxR
MMDSFDWHETGLTVGQAAERSGGAASALRFYEWQGLISADRNATNQRRYRGDVLCRVAMIRVCRQAGLSLAQIRAALAEAIPDGCVG